MFARATSAVVATLVLSHPALVGAQTDFSIELGASQVSPPEGVDGESARFGVGGVRLSHYTMGGSGLTASILFGQAFQQARGGDFVSGSVGGTLLGQWTTHWSGALDARAFGFSIQSPFPYSAVALEGGPSIAYRSSHVGVRLAGIAGVGDSRVELRRRPGGRVLVLESDLWRTGGSAEVMFGGGSTWFGLGGETHNTGGGRYGAGSMRLLIGGSIGAAEFRMDRWDTPLGAQTTGGVALVLNTGGWSLKGFFGKSGPDPLTLTEPGNGSAALLLGRSLYHRNATPSIADGLYEVLEDTGDAARVRLSVEPPEGTGRVDILGDFTLWDVVPMRRQGDEWVVELDVQAGTHHFGFLVDDEWYVPDDATDVVPDEWGRLSAILVIEGEGP